MMNEKQYTRLASKQKEQVHSHLLGKPTALSQGFSLADFSREFDIYVYEADPNPRYQLVKTYLDEPITSGRFFRIVKFSHKVLGSLFFNHDRYGVFGEPKTVPSFRLADLKLSKAQYEEFLSDLSEIIHSIDPRVKIEWDGMEFLSAGPVVIST